MRQACLVLSRSSPNGKIGLGEGQSPDTHHSPALVAITCALLGNNLPEDGWYAAAQAAVKALFTLAAEPHVLTAALLEHLLQATFSGTGHGMGHGCVH